MLIRVESLRNLLSQEGMTATTTSDDILDQYWKIQGNIFSLIDKENFKRCKWYDLHRMKYAVLSYQWRTPWRIIIDFIFGPEGVKAKYIWIDVFCLNQLDGNRMKTILRSNEIYWHSTDYHLIELGSLFRGWVLFELSSAKKGTQPKLHYS